ncbi:phytanoyl-CoA dioxygenase family protein [Halioglobus pacificus]|uniref:Phytanoyl-CoA dioxygenase n=1 Tax=Parahalioglobus pacificus TaxID=930806 RepID=A0A919CK30_9GAMM|nr:phytanoyl-CoA dioxygenase family protein [Halioglobus pacificus]GHD32126.1 hypothetical protein GCM10007053_15900 [Halioglobus pacificus]
MPALAHFSSKNNQREMLQALKHDGAIIVDDLMSAEQVSATVGELDPYVQATGNGQDDFSGRLTTRTDGLVSRSAQCREVIQHPLILDLCNTFLSPYCERVQLHLGQVIRIKPGQPTQPIHRDRWAWGTHLAHVEPQFNTIWALTDFTEENGATQVVPGSTIWPDDRAAEESEITQATMRAGSVLMYSGSVFHGGGENRSESDRWGLNITYTLGWLRQEENQYLSTPPELAKELSPELQELIGYAMGQYALGYYTPPGAPGSGPEVVPPQYALGRTDVANALGTPEDLAAISQVTNQEYS